MACINHQSVLSCLAQLLPLACNGSLDEEVRDQTGVGQQSLGDRGGGVVLQPVLHGSLLICVPICSYHRLHHCLHLHMPVFIAAVSAEVFCSQGFQSSTAHETFNVISACSSHLDLQC